MSSIYDTLFVCEMSKRFRNSTQQKTATNGGNVYDTNVTSGVTVPCRGNDNRRNESIYDLSTGEKGFCAKHRR
jgi:hypothetical protein